MPEASPVQLMHILFGYWKSQALYVAAKLGVADQLRQGPKTPDELATTVGAHGPSLARLLRALASIGIFAADEQGRYGLTPLAEFLLSDHPSKLRSTAMMFGEEHYVCYGRLIDGVRTGETVFDKIYGLPTFEYLAAHPEQGKIFDDTMTGVHGRETAEMLDAYDFPDVQVLADIGGGNGSLLIQTLQRYPHLRGLLYDLPHVVERATQNIAQASVAERCQTSAGSFFENVPAGADAYLLRHIIHDWDDEKSLRILGHVRKVIPPHGKLLIVESVIPTGNEPCMGKFLDLTMLLLVGGKERTLEEYRDLFARAGFRLDKTIATRGEMSILQSSPV